MHELGIILPQTCQPTEWTLEVTRMVAAREGQSRRETLIESGSFGKRSEFQNNMFFQKVARAITIPLVPCWQLKSAEKVTYLLLSNACLWFHGRSKSSILQHKCATRVSRKKNSWNKIYVFESHDISNCKTANLNSCWPMPSRTCLKTCNKTSYKALLRTS